MKEKEIDKDTVVAYHDYVQGQIRGELNGISLGPGKLYAQLALISFIAGLASGIVGILVVTLRTRHVYLISWDDQFLGPFFVLLFLMLVGFAVACLVQAKRRANEYRRELVFRPIGDYGVAVVHKSRLNFEQTTRETLKSGTAPNKPALPKPYQPVSYRTGNYPPRGPGPGGYENRGYRGPPPGYDGRRGPPPDRRHPDDRRRHGPPDDRRRYGPPDERRRYGPPDGNRPPPYRDGPPDRRGPPPHDRYRDGPPGEKRRPPPDDRYRGGPPGDRYRTGPPPDDRYADAPRDPEKRKMYEEERRRRKQYEAERSGPPKVKLEGMQEGDESSF